MQIARWEQHSSQFQAPGAALKNAMGSGFKNEGNTNNADSGMSSRSRDVDQMLDARIADEDFYQGSQNPLN